MNFEEKSLKLTAFKVELHETAGELLRQAKAKAARPIDQIPQDLDAVDTGWASGKLELDFELQPKNCIIGELLYLAIRSARYKINAELLKAYTRKLAADWLDVNPDKEYVPAKVRKELREEALMVLSRKATLCISSIPVIVCPNGTVYTGAASQSEIDTVVELFYQTFKLELVPVNAAALIGDKGKDINGTTGRDFLVWLLWQSETSRKARHSLDAPFEFVNDQDEDCDHATARGNRVANSREARQALVCGKGLRKAKFTLVGDTNPGDVWTFSLNADLFAFTGLKLPQGDEMTPDGVFIERLDMIGELLGWFYDQFETFWDEFEYEDYAARKSAWLAER